MSLTTIIYIKFTAWTPGRVAVAWVTANGDLNKLNQTAGLLKTYKHIVKSDIMGPYICSTAL